MTSEVDALKTNEFLRRRKLRIQQVREQSKDIAKIIRQRANSEKFRQLISIDEAKEKEYLEQQDKLIKKLEQLHAKSIENIGASHKKAAETTQEVNKQERSDLLKRRAREAAAELRRQKQEKLDERKKLLDRKLQAREIANEISREKSITNTNKLSKSSVKGTEEAETSTKPATIPEKSTCDENDNEKVITNDMGTQWDFESWPNEWEPNVPSLSLPKDDTPKEPTSTTTENHSAKNKRPNLFAVSEEMPSSLRGGIAKVPEDTNSLKPPLTIVSDYIQNRDLRLRDYDSKHSKRSTGDLDPKPSKRSTEDLQKLKQTILRSRASKAEVSAKSAKNKPTKPESLIHEVAKKSSVTMYNHSTRDIRDVPYADQRLVSRDHQANEDAYSQAMRETSSEQSAKDKDHQKKLQDMRSKIAVTKQSVEKEYQDTIAFLNSLPKEKTKPLKNVYKDAYQEQAQLQHKQRKLQHEFRKIQKECRKQAHPTMRSTHKAKFAKTQNSDGEDNDFDSKDMQYSWMPVPESDQGLAVHIIPTKTKDQKSSNTVKFSKIDSYHEYRSRHKHTPPTKDTPANEAPQKVTETEFIQDQDMDTSISSTAADASSVEDLRLGKDKTDSNSDQGSDTERIIIYKILDTKSNRKKKRHSRCSTAKTLNFGSKEDKDRKEKAIADSMKEDAINLLTTENTKTPNNGSCFFSKQLEEGIYKTVSKKGDNMSSVGLTDEQKQNSPSKTETYNVNRTPQHAGDRGGECASQPANSASGSSFKTAATTNKTLQQQLQTEIDETNCLPPGGYVKVIDQNGQESGKFFIGATGFLKDDAYEVTIKLRKTDTIKSDKKDSTNKSNGNITTENPKSDLGVSVAPEKMHAATSTDVIEQVNDVHLDANTQASVLPKQHDLIDKGIDVPFENSYIYPKFNSDKQPGNSVSVQTTLDSSELRYHRMSSSTSTAYMSPPEVILPRYLRHDDFVEEGYTDGTRNPNVYMVNHETRLHPKRTSPKQKANLSSPPKRALPGKKLKTPPNTARSLYSPCTRKNAPLTVTVPKTGKKKCQKRVCYKTCLKSQIQKMKSAVSSNLLAPPPSVHYTNSQNSRTNGFSLRKQDLNPLVKQYVDKLLHMNKEGIKAINVENQDCSSVTTPGSSIIDDPNNINKNECKLEPKISLEQLKQLIEQHVVKKIAQELEDYEIQERIGDAAPKVNCVKKPTFCFSKRRSVHKVKSLNISRSLSRKSSTRQKPVSNAQSSYHVSRASPSKDDHDISSEVPTKQKHRSKSYPSPRRLETDDKVKHKTNSFEGISDKNAITRSSIINDIKIADKVSSLANKKTSGSVVQAVPSRSEGHETVISSWNYDYSSDSNQKNPPCSSLHSSTQTSRKIDEQISYVKMAEDKLQNMEKIADLTEKCTQRLSNLAKVLEEVRKNKLSYSHASESASDTDQVSGKNSESIPTTIYEPIIEIKQKDTLIPPSSETIRSPVAVTPTSPQAKPDKHLDKSMTTDKVKKHSPQLKRPKSPGSVAKACNIRSPIGVNNEHHLLKNRGKPPPALTRRCLKRTQEYVIPHELSTVVEIDSPISTKYNKSQSAQQSTKCESFNDAKSEEDKNSINNAPIAEEVSKNNPDLLDTKSAIQSPSKITKEPAEDSQTQMMDLKQFNDIMLKPFISIQEYAKQCNLTKLEDGSNIETLLRGDVITDELSSLHSDGSLPDVIAELLKRNIISEPFKFDTVSNVNSTTVSSDSTLSVLALSKVKKGKKKLRSPFSNKDKVEESSDTLSASSNPDLEKAFKQLGMGWASSTLKKTKERLALSSSSTNTSSSSLSQFKLKTVNTKDFPVLVTDSMSSIRNATNMIGCNDRVSGQRVNDDSKKATGQQTSVANSLTVKQFLTNELAKRITFGDRSHSKDTEEEFVSLCETKMPEEMQRTLKHEDRSIDSNPRARTSTPVQIFKSMTYHSSSSSNVSNGLFSNADDLSSVKGTSNSLRNHSTSEKDDLTIPNFSLRTKKGLSSDYSRSDD